MIYGEQKLKVEEYKSVYGSITKIEQDEGIADDTIDGLQKFIFKNKDNRFDKQMIA